MLRITPAAAVNGTATLRLEGQLAGPWVATLRESCEPLLTCGCALTLDLAAVSLIDRDGFAFLDSLTHRAVAFTGCSPFQAEQLRQLAAAPSTATL
jgi:ABC-type transporter Mla MlaB component